MFFTYLIIVLGLTFAYWGTLVALPASIYALVKEPEDHCWTWNEFKQNPGANKIFMWGTGIGLSLFSIPSLGYMIYTVLSICLF